MANRVETVVTDIVDNVRAALKRHDVTFDEYRTAVKHFMEVAASGETPLLIDVFFNTTICDIENGHRTGSLSTLEGPYFLEGAPFVEGALKTYSDDRHQPLLLHGRVLDTEGRPVAGAVIDVWHSTPDGLYGGFHGDIPADYYRGKIRTDAQGRYEVRTTTPVPYQIPHLGPTGALLDAMGRHSWRPAHVHYKIRAEGFAPLTTQAYFERDKYLTSDCCEGVYDELVHAERAENGVRVVETDFALDRSLVPAHSA